MRLLPRAAVAALLLVGCGNGPLTVSEYAEAAEQLVMEMEEQFESLDREWESQPPTVDGADRYWEGRLEIRAEFLAGVEDLEPPEDIAPMHETALAVFADITAADEALAARVASYDSVTDHWQWVDTPEGQAAEAVLEEVYRFCRASQAEFDATADRRALADAPWLPSEMTEIVSVAFGCPK